MKLTTILFNKRYCIGSLYGAGIFPFWLYVKYFGCPIYRLGRRFGLNTYFSLMVANILGSLFHVSFFIGGFTTSNIIAFPVSLVVCASLLSSFHKSYHRSRTANISCK